MKPGLEARRLALEALLQVDRGAFAGEWIAAHGRRLTPADRGLALEIALVTLRWKLLLDENLRPRLKRWPGERVGWILRTALAQAWMLDRIPNHAAVDLAVDLARDLEGRAMSGLVNAVLRRALEAGLQKPEGNTPRDLAIAYSHPEWLVQRWFDRVGDERTIEWLTADNAVPPVWVRPNPARADIVLPWSEEQILGRALGGRFLRLSSSRHELLDSDAFRQGAFSFQDPSSGRAALAIAPYIKAGGSFLDLCGAPGSKSAMLAEMGLFKDVHAFSCDRSFERQLRTVDGFQRLGIHGVSVLCVDGIRPPFAPGSFDAILLDAPCSNLGVLSRRPEARWRLRPADLTEHAKLQKALLGSAFALLKPGGVLAYSTCTVEPEETEDLIYALLESHQADSIRLDNLENPEPGSPLFLRTMPGPANWDGFFTALLRKPEADD